MGKLPHFLQECFGSEGFAKTQAPRKKPLHLALTRIPVRACSGFLLMPGNLQQAGCGRRWGLCPQGVDTGKEKNQSNSRKGQGF